MSKEFRPYTWFFGFWDLREDIGVEDEHGSGCWDRSERESKELEQIETDELKKPELKFGRPHGPQYHEMLRRLLKFCEFICMQFLWNQVLQLSQATEA